jgi:hypothetical protein
MSLLLSLLAVLIAASGLFVHLLPTFFPKLGIGVLYNVGRIKWAIRIVALALVVIGIAIEPTTGKFMALGAVLWFALISNSVFNPSLVLPAIDNPKHLPASELKPSQLTNDAPVLGTTVGSAACAWSIDALVPHHAVNDTVGTSPVVATWCAACRSGLVFSRVVQGRTLNFEVAGVWRRNLILRDRETETLWQQATGEALIGPLQGAKLEPLTSVQTTWEAWRDENPDTHLSLRPKDAKGLLPLDVVESALATVTARFTAPGLSAPDRRLAPHTEVVGITLASGSKAYTIDALMRKMMVDDRVGGTPVKLTFDARQDRVRAFSKGKPIPLQRQLWSGWSEFHPGSALYEELPAPKAL